MAYQSTGLASGGLGVSRQQFVNGQPVSYYVDPNPATLVVPQIVPRPVALPPLVARNNLGFDDPNYTSLSFNGPPEEIGAWANAYANATANNAPVSYAVPPTAASMAVGGDNAANPGVGNASPFAPRGPAPQFRRQAALQIVQNPPQIGLVNASLPPSAPIAPPAPPMPGQPNVAPPAALPDDQPGEEVETFHDAEEDQDVDQEGIGGGDGEPAVVPGAIPEPAASSGGPPPPPPPPPSGWHPGMRVVDASFTPAGAPTPVVDVIAALSEGTAINNPTISNAPSGTPAAAGVAPSVPAGATATTNAMMGALAEMEAGLYQPAAGSPIGGSTEDLSVPVQAGLGIPPPPPPPPSGGGPVRSGKKGKNKGKGKAHPVPDQYAENRAAEAAAFSGSAAAAPTRLSPQQELMAAIRGGTTLKKAPPRDVRKTAGGGDIAGPKPLAPNQKDVGGDDIQAALRAALAKRNARIGDDEMDENGNVEMTDAERAEWDMPATTAVVPDVEMNEGYAASTDPNARANFTNVMAEIQVAGRARRETGFSLAPKPDFGSDEAFNRGKFDQVVPDDEDPGFRPQDLPSPVSTRRSPPAVKKGKKPSPKRANKPKAKNPPKAGPP